MASNRSRYYNVREAARLVLASDEKIEAEISNSDVDLPLLDYENQTITSHDSSDKEGETTRPSRKACGKFMRYRLDK